MRAFVSKRVGAPVEFENKLKPFNPLSPQHCYKMYLFKYDKVST